MSEEDGSEDMKAAERIVNKRRLQARMEEQFNRVYRTKMGILTTISYIVSPSKRKRLAHLWFTKGAEMGIKEFTDMIAEHVDEVEGSDAEWNPEDS